jgi:hypothetical protein
MKRFERVCRRVAKVAGVVLLGMSLGLCIAVGYIMIKESVGGFDRGGEIKYAVPPMVIENMDRAASLEELRAFNKVVLHGREQQ